MKFSVITFLGLSFFAIQNVTAQYELETALLYAGTCPEGGLDFYKDCGGSLKQCSTCLGNAQNACEKALGQSCEGCTTRSQGQCSNAQSMCYNDQECQSQYGSSFSCINNDCVRSS